MSDQDKLTAEDVLPSPLRVCVLTSSYEGSDSILQEFEGTIPMNPGYYFDQEDDKGMVQFVQKPLQKKNVYRDIRALVKSNEYDVFFNLCDGAKDEDRAGEEVVKALEEFHVPFTGAASKYYELSKPDMKMVAHYNKVASANFCVLEAGDDIATLCQHLSFPVIVKHVSGYSSIGMTKDSKCLDMEHLIRNAEEFISEYQFALVEEFITGDEVTVLACADSTQPGGVRVFHPVMVNFPEGEDFKHFNLKWADFEGMEWVRVPDDDPALEQIIDIGRESFTHMLGGVGYGRCDLRINRKENKVVFLEINPNCGIMYPPDQEGSADWILRLGKKEFGHRDFVMLQIREAISRCKKEKPLFRRAFDPVREYHLRASQYIPKGDLVFSDEGREFRLVTKPYVDKKWSEQARQEFGSSCWPIGTDRHYYAIWDVDPAKWRSFNHSCEPNLSFAPDRSLNVVAIRDIRPGEELTMDYRQFCDDTMTSFDCHCGAKKCPGTIHPKQPRMTPPRGSSEASSTDDSAVVTPLSSPEASPTSYNNHNSTSTPPRKSSVRAASGSASPPVQHSSILL